MDELSHVIYVAQGDIPGQLIVADKTVFNVIEEVWERARLLDTKILASFHSRLDAQRFRDAEQDKREGN